MTQQRHDAALAARLYAPGPLIGDIVNMGDSLSTSCATLTRCPCSECADKLLSQLQAAQHAIGRFRQALAGGS